SILVMMIIGPLLWKIYGPDYFHAFFDLHPDPDRPMFAGPADVFLSLVLPAVAIVIFWIARQATPGKMALSLRVVDAETLGPISKGQAIGRYLGYYVSILVFCLGLLWVGFDARKQGWHDKLAGTLVIKEQRR